MKRNPIRLITNENGEAQDSGSLYIPMEVFMATDIYDHASRLVLSMPADLTDQQILDCATIFYASIVSGYAEGAVPPKNRVELLNELVAEIKQNWFKKTLTLLELSGKSRE